MSYATSTSVPVERSRAEIENLLRRYGASQFVSGWDSSRAAIGFVFGKLSVRFELPLPDPSADEFTKTPAGRRRRNVADQMRAWEQACRSRWRAFPELERRSTSRSDRSSSRRECGDAFQNGDELSAFVRAVAEVARREAP